VEPTGHRIESGPREGENLAAAHPGGRGGSPQRVEPIAVSVLEEGSQVLLRPGRGSGVRDDHAVVDPARDGYLQDHVRGPDRRSFDVMCVVCPTTLPDSEIDDFMNVPRSRPG
jgi:hypothetical protein